MQALEPFYDKLDPAFLNVRKVVREVLQKEEDLNEIVQLVGKVGSGRICAAAPAHAHQRLCALAQWCASRGKCCLQPALDTPSCTTWFGLRVGCKG